MKKYILLLIFCLALTGCTKNKMNSNQIHTIIEEEKNILIGINYPVTGQKKIDQIIKKDVEIIYNNFKSDYEQFDHLKEQSELNIDYTYEKINNRYINITLHIFINSSTLANPINYMKSYVFDQQQNKLLTLQDIIAKESFPQFVTILKTELIKKYKNCILLDELKATITTKYPYPFFTFDNENLTIYFNPTEITAYYCDIIDIIIPLKSLKLNISIEPEIETETTITIPKYPRVIDPENKVVALTFDDGPTKYTKEILEILKENDACATFFVIGNKVEIYKETMQQMIFYGNEIGNHSYNHKWLTKLTEKDLKEQINQTQNVIHSVTGFTPTLIRPTYGSISSKLKKQIPLEIVMWTVDTSDWKYKSVDRIVKEATKKTKDLDIILMHDTHQRTVEALKKIIPELKKQGFKFVTVSELDEIKLLRKQNTEI